jgi:uncharacterized protein
MTEEMGRGVFAVAPIRANEQIDDVFYTVHIPAEEVRAMAGGTLSRFWFEDDKDGSASFVCGYIELMNHDPVPNIDRSWQKTPAGDVVTLRAIRDIEPGEQLFIDYRFEGGSNEPSWARRRPAAGRS